MNAASTDVFNVDPLLSMRIDATAIADLAFGSLTVGDSQLGNRHLALLTAETLELDLTDPAQRQFGDYELLEMIGEGGMGVVYRARQASLDRALHAVLDGQITYRHRARTVDLQNLAQSTAIKHGQASIGFHCDTSRVVSAGDVQAEGLGGIERKPAGCVVRPVSM